MITRRPHRWIEAKKIEDLAEDFYRDHLQDLAENPDLAGGHSLAAAIDLMTRTRRDDDAVGAALDAWITAKASKQHLKPDQLEPQRPLLRLMIEAAVWASQITTTFFEMSTMYPSVKERLNLPDEEKFWLDQPPRDYRPLVPEAPMGNMLALRWAANRNGGASLQLLWVHGVGRWLLHHAHDLLACEGVDGPHVMLMSATSWAPGSTFYHIPIIPTLVLRQPDEDRQALLTSHLTVKPQNDGSGQAIFVSGRQATARHDALRQLVSRLCLPGNGRRRSVLDELRDELPADRRQVLFVVLSGDEARTVAEYLNNHTPFRARNVVPDAADPQRSGILRRRVTTFGHGDDDVLVAAEMAIQRGYNILNKANTAALGAVVYLTRSHPPPADLAFPLSVVNEFAMRQLCDPVQAEPGQLWDTSRTLRRRGHALWFDSIGHPMTFRTLTDTYRPAFVANNLVPMSQTIGRSIRGNKRTTVLLCDGAFAERLATADTAADTNKTSLVVATDEFLTSLLAPPAADADLASHQLHAINEAVWGLMGHLICTNEPLGSQRRHLSA